ncbi:hypothetical protein DSO57_1020348 [Entomophthora muscae]|uniref:Uncharacterized protein n=1 Tax=Entomophthora muscae TaxID=34485 RepID=A0ACC2U1R2_9FUNG|nr:hypothetical protein DSO57_1020348 [Entomophthora muscae]
MYTNTSPYEEAIQKSMTRINNGADDKGQQLQLLAIQHPSGKVSMERFFNMGLDLQAAEHVKDYIQHFAHPVICHNQVHLGRLQS